MNSVDELKQIIQVGQVYLRENAQLDSRRTREIVAVSSDYVAVRYTDGLECSWTWDDIYSYYPFWTLQTHPAWRVSEGL